MIPGYLIIPPACPECITHFGMLGYEDESTLDAPATWPLEAHATHAIVAQQRHGQSR